MSSHDQTIGDGFPVATPQLPRRILMRIGMSAAIATAMVIGVLAVTGGNGAAGNLWVGASGSCTRSATPVAYNAATSCASFSAAYTAAANSGDTVCVASGNYGAQTVAYVAGKTTPATVIQGCGATQPVIASLVVGDCAGGNQTRAVTFKDMEITGSADARAIFICYGTTDPTTRATDITFDNIDMAVGKATNGPVFEDIGGALRLTIKNSTIGPACCGNNGSGAATGSPVGIRIGTANRVVADSWPTNTDTVIDNNLIQGITRTCTQWLSGYGSCPSTTCTDAVLCHADAVQVYGSTGLIMSNNRVYHNQINGIFIDSTDPNVDGTLKNNMVGDVMDGAPCFDLDGRGLRGTWNAINNTCAAVAGDDNFDVTWAKDDPDGVGPGQSMEQAGTVFNWKGNVGAVKVNQSSSGTVNCTGTSTGVFNYSYNTWSTNNGSSTGCGGNETIGDATYANTALAPTNTMDLHLSGATSVADNKIPSATCSGFVTTDIDGQSRPIDANCDAGADER